METVGKFLLFGGFLVAVISQIYIIVLAFRKKIIDGILCFVVPAYILYWAMRQETRQTKVLITWSAGLVAFIVGVALLSN